MVSGKKTDGTGRIPGSSWPNQLCFQKMMEYFEPYLIECRFIKNCGALSSTTSVLAMF